jgi:primosomal protein N' (replication factor Y)
MKGAKSTEAAFDDIREGRADIVVGTQMMAKGHDFPNLRTVLVLDADARLHQPDYRSAEQLFALLLQVAGRAGRHPNSSPLENAAPQGSAAGVWIQTHYPEHPLMRAITAPGFDSQKAFWATLLADRAHAGLPPYRYLALIRLSHRNAKAVEDAAKAIYDRGTKIDGVRIYPPVPQYPERVANKTRWQLILESASRSQLHAAVEELDMRMASTIKVDATIEIDPLGFSG